MRGIACTARPLTCADINAADTVEITDVQLVLVEHQPMRRSELCSFAEAVFVIPFVVSRERAHSVRLTIDAPHAVRMIVRDIDQSVRRAHEPRHWGTKLGCVARSV